MKFLKPGLIILTIGLVAYNSVYFKSLDEVKSATATKNFDAATYAQDFWNSKLTPAADAAQEMSQLLKLLHEDPESTFDKYSHALGIGNLRYFLVKGTATVDEVQSDFVTLGGHTIATEFIFGNQVRDATGLIDITEFTNTMDFNNVSAELNKIIRESVLPSFKSKVKKGDSVSFVGAFELNKEHADLEHIEIIPIRLTIN